MEGNYLGAFPKNVTRKRVVLQTERTDIPAACVVVVVSRVKAGKGGVATYFRSLEGELDAHTRYLSIGEKNKSKNVFFGLFRFCADLMNLWRWAGEEKVGVVHLNPSLLWKAVLREGLHILIAKGTGKRVLVFWHGWHWGCARQLENGLFRRLFHGVYGRVDCHVVLAEEFRQGLRNLGCKGPIICESTVVSEAALGLPSQGTTRWSSEEPVRLLFLSRVEKEKGIYAAIDATTQVRAKGYPVSLVVAGDGTERVRAEEYVKHKNIKGISFVGYLRGDEKKNVLLKSDIFLFPSSHGEGMPLSVLDAMAAGLPVLCTRAGGLKDFFQDGQMGFSAAEPSTTLFAALIERLISDPEQAKAMGQYNREFARRYFSAPVVGRRLLRIYEFLLSGAPLDRVPPDWMEEAQAKEEVDPCRAHIT